MALLYPWATKEYVLWEMTWSQVMMYINEGLNQKYPQPNRTNAKKAVDMGYDELKEKRDELRRLYGNIG